MLAELTKTAGNDRMNWMGTNLLNEVFCTMKDMYYTMNIAGLDRDLPLCPISDKLMIGAFVIFGDMELTTACAKALLERIPEHDVMITAESKGIPLICELAKAYAGVDPAKDPVHGTELDENDQPLRAERREGSPDLVQMGDQEEVSHDVKGRTHQIGQAQISCLITAGQELGSAHVGHGDRQDD